jgi:predicted dehydrogenase
MWLGSAPWRPYNHAYAQGPGVWRTYTDFGGGGITDWGCHSADLCQWAHGSDLTGPRHFERQGDTVVATYADGVKLVFKDNIGPGSCGIRLEGEEGWVYTADELDLEISSPSLMPRGYKKEAWTRVVGHVKNFLDSVKTRRRATIYPEVAHRSVSICHAANLCVRLGRPLTWDPVQEEFVGDEEANRLRSRPSRLPWLPL